VRLFYEFPMDFRPVKVLTFDCYGTLIDWETGILSVLRPWAARCGLHSSDEELLAAFGRTETVVQQTGAFCLYPEVLREVHRDIGRQFSAPVSDEDARALSGSVGDWPAFPDTPGALQRLHQRFKLVIVSNVDNASFAHTHHKLGLRMDAVVTAEDVGAYKPDARMFERAFEVVKLWDVSPPEILHVAESLYHDHLPAKKLGLSTVWIHRRFGKSGSGATPTLVPPASVPPALALSAANVSSRQGFTPQAVTPDLVVKTLGELAGLACSTSR